jgi:MYXO-CTERM domain-containing protein
VCLCNDGYVTDNSTGTATCVVPPGGCGDETFFGRCQGKGLVFCGEDGIAEVDCDGAGLICGLVDSRIGFDCLNPNGLGAAAGCDPSMYQQCGATNPFCIADSADDAAGFCSLECASQLDCAEQYGCCATVSDGTRACLPTSYCAELLDVNVTCDDVEGGSNYFGSCQGNTLRYCDPSTKTTLEIPCTRAGKVCGFESEQAGHNCVPPGNTAVAPSDYCPLSENGQCDAPAQCPEGTDLLDCNPCGEVTAQGTCEGDTLKLCDATAGLVTTDCARLPEAATCLAASGDDAASCVADDATPGTDAGTKDAGAAGTPGSGGKRDAGDEQQKPEEEETASCSCTVGPGATRSHSGHSGYGAGLLLALAATLLTRRRPRA